MECEADEAPSYVGITAFNDSDITFRAMFKTHTFENWGAEREFNRRVAFEQEGIEIPFLSARCMSFRQRIEGVEVRRSY